MTKVHYDVSFVARNQERPRPTTGVGRVLLEVARRLQKSDELQLRIVGCFADDWNPVATEHCASEWAAEVLGDKQLYTSSCASKTRLVQFLANLQLKFEYSQRTSIVGQFALRVLRRLGKQTTYLQVESDAVFVSTFFAPPELLPNSIPRVFFIYDVYPLQFPEQCGPDVVGNLKKIIAAVDDSRDIAVSISEFTKHEFCRLTGFPRERVVVAHLAADASFQPVDSTKVKAIQELYGLHDAPYLLSVCNPQPRKNLVTAIRAFADATAQLPEWTGNLVLIGNNKVGWGTSEIDKAIQEVGTVSKRIVLLGAVPEEHLPALYAGAFAFLFPSSYEGFGLPVLEAMQSGAPVICSDSTSLPEVVGKAALMCSPLSVSGFSDAIVSLLNDHEKRDRLKQMGLQRATAFTWDRTAEKVQQAIQLAAYSKRPSGS